MNHFGRQDFKEFVYLKLQLSGLKTPNPNEMVCPYSSLFQNFLTSGQNSFDEQSLRDICKQANLIEQPSSTEPKIPKIGVRSFLRAAERLEDDVDEFICVSEFFDGRFPAQKDSWFSIGSQVLSFLAEPERRAQLRGIPSVIALECHGSLALLAGWELSRNSGVSIAPIQKPGLEVWMPSLVPYEDDSWETEIIEGEIECDEVAFCLSVTHDVRSDVEMFLKETGAPKIGRVIIASPRGGPSPRSIKGVDHAYALANSFPSILKKTKKNLKSCTHIFFACPNALLFFIGQHQQALGRLILYEFDQLDRVYQPSFTIPLAPPIPADKIQETLNETGQ